MLKKHKNVTCNDKNQSIKMDSGQFLFTVWHVKSLEVITPCKQWVKMEQPEKSTALLRSIRELRSWGKLLPSKLDRQVNTENYNLPEWNPQLGTVLGQENLTCHWWISGGFLQTSLRVKHSRWEEGDSLREAFALLWLLPLGASPCSHSEDWRKISWFWQGKRGK